MIHFKFMMVALAHAHALELEKYLQQYIMEDSEYIIAKETCKNTHKETEGQHFHIAVEMDDRSYDNFRKTVLVNHYGLRGRASKTLPRQYGVVKDVRDETKFLSYTCKDKNILTNITDKARLEKYIEDSYERKEKQQFEEQLFDLLEQSFNHNPKEPVLSTYFLELHILQMFRDLSDKLPAKSTIRFYALKFLLRRTETKTSQILDLMYDK